MMSNDVLNSTFVFGGKTVKFQTLEKAKNYETVVIFVELENVEHSGFTIKKGDKTLAKGEIAKKVRDAKIDGVEMAVAPPSDTNAIIMARITKPVDAIMEEILDIVFESLRENGFV